MCTQHALWGTRNPARDNQQLQMQDWHLLPLPGSDSMVCLFVRVSSHRFSKCIFEYVVCVCVYIYIYLYLYLYLSIYLSISLYIYIDI